MRPCDPPCTSKETLAALIHRLTLIFHSDASQDCFVHVYGPLPERNRFGDMRKPQSFGVCGVCRKSMKVGESGAAGNISSGKASSESSSKYFIITI